MRVLLDPKAITAAGVAQAIPFGFVELGSVKFVVPDHFPLLAGGKRWLKLLGRVVLSLGRAKEKHP